MSVPMRHWLVSLLLVTGCSAGGDFDAQRWRDADLATRERVNMVDGLLKEHPLEGLTRSEVVSLLGEPTPTDKWEDWDMVYVLGPTEYMPIDHEWLVVRLDDAGRVTEHDLVSD